LQIVPVKIFDSELSDVNLFSLMHKREDKVCS